MSVKNRSWVWISVAIALVCVASMFSPVLALIQRTETSVALAANGLLGHNVAFDHLLGSLNTRSGDALMIVALVLFVVAHIFARHDVAERRRRVAFWGFFALTFVAAREIGVLIEEAVSRASPGRVLAEQWFNVNERYGIDVRTSAGSCFPSGHAFAWYYAAFFALRRHRRAGLALLVVALTLPSTRIALGSHWAGDIFLGAMPLALLFTALSFETPVAKLEGLMVVGLEGLQRVWEGRRRRPLIARLVSAWRAFIDDDPARDRPNVEVIHSPTRPGRNTG